MLIRHSAVYVAGKLGPGILGMATTAMLTRLLPPETYGLYGVALVIMVFGSTLGFEWLGLAYLRLATTSSDPAKVAGTFNRLFLGLLAVAGLVAALASASVRAADRPVVLAGFVMMVSFATFEFRARVPIANLRPGAYLRMNLIRAVAILGAAGTTAYLTRDAAWTGVATAAATFAASWFGGAAVRGAGFDRALAGAAIRFGLPLAASLALGSLAGSATRAMVAGLGGIGALGLYTAASMLVQNTLIVLSAGLASAGYALAVRTLQAGDPATTRRQLSANGALLLAVLAPASLGMALTATNLAGTLVGPAFRADVARLTPLLAGAALLTGLRAHYFDHAFHLGQRMAGQVWVTVSAAAVTLGVAFLLIPFLGPLGAGIATLLGAAVGAVHATVAGRSAFPMPLPLAQAARVAGACAFMAVCVLAVPGSGLGALTAQVAAGVTAYGSAAVALDVIGLRRALARRVGLGWTRTA